jgi:pilus assembly protein Flp/PilA
MVDSVRRFWRDDSGATAIEYGLLSGLIAVACIVAFVIFGNSLVGLFGFVQNRAGNAINSAT